MAECHVRRQIAGKDMADVEEGQKRQCPVAVLSVEYNESIRCLAVIASECEGLCLCL